MLPSHNAAVTPITSATHQDGIGQVGLLAAGGPGAVRAAQRGRQVGAVDGPAAMRGARSRVAMAAGDDLQLPVTCSLLSKSSRRRLAADVPPGL